MRFDNYLTEKKALSIKQLQNHELFRVGYDDHFATDEFLEVAAKIRKECKFAIDLCRKNKRWFYRGVSGHHRKVGEKSVRSERRPKDTDPYVHKMFDSTLEELFGWKARSSGLFVTSDYTQAKDFGSPMIVFPTGKFDYVWSPKEEDSINTIQDGPIRLTFADQYGGKIQKEIMDEHSVWIINDRRWSPFGLRGTWEKMTKFPVHEPGSLEKFVKYMVGIMKADDRWQTDEGLDEYVRANLLRYDLERKVKSQVTLELYKDGIKGESKYPWVNQAIRDIMEKMVADDLDYTDTNIEKAMSSNHEIMVRSPKYYYFDSYYDRLLKLYLGI